MGAHSASFSRAMAPHLTNDELGLITRSVALKKTAAQIHSAISRTRRKGKVDPPKIWAVRRAMAGVTHKRGKTETRGRPLRLSGAQVQRLMTRRAQLIVKSKGERYIGYDAIARSARVLKVNKSTVARYLRPFGVAWHAGVEGSVWRRRQA